MTERPRPEDPDVNQLESEEDYQRQRQGSRAAESADEDARDVDANYDGNEGADERVRIEQPSGDEAPRA